MLKRLSIGKKLALISVTLALVLLGLVGFMLFELRDTIIEERKVKLRSLVELAVNEVNRYSQLAADGKMSPEEARKQATAAVANLNFDGKNYYWVVERNGTLVWHPTRKEDVGKNMLKLENVASRRNYEQFIESTKANPYLEAFVEIMGRRPGSTTNDAQKLILSAQDKKWGWIVSTGIFVDDVDELFYQRATLFMGLAFAGLLLGVGLSWALGRTITRPLNHTVTALEELCEGRSDTVVQIDPSRTEIGRLTQAFTQFRDKMKEAEALRKQQAVAEQKAQEERRAGLLSFANEFEQSVASAVEALAEEVRKVSRASEEMSQSAKSSASGTQQVNTAATAAADNVQTVASAAQELTSSIEEIGRQVRVVQDVVEKTQTRSIDTQGQISALAETVEKIGSVVELINGIADQTNLLALNATIEAARAGEVKALANQTTKATDDIRQQIEVLGHTTSRSVDGIQDIATVIGELQKTTAAIAAAIEQQNAATGEISRNTEVTARETQAITTAISDVTASVRTTESVAQSVSETSSAMQEKAEVVGKAVDDFLRRVRAA